MATSTPTGINTNSIPRIKQAIEEYIKLINAKNITLAAKNVNAALKGSAQQNAVRQFSMRCNSYADSLTSGLRAFETTLDTVKAKYMQNDASSTAITDVANKIRNLSQKS